jgi:hypothetical protein
MHRAENDLGYKPETAYVDDDKFFRAEVIIGLAAPVWRKLNLNDVLGNDQGRFLWGSGRFADSSERVKYDPAREVLGAGLKTGSGWRTNHDEAKLLDFIRVKQGKLVGPLMKEVEGKKVPVAEASISLCFVADPLSDPARQISSPSANPDEDAPRT